MMKCEVCGNEKIEHTLSGFTLFFSCPKCDAEMKTHYDALTFRKVRGSKTK